MNRQNIYRLGFGLILAVAMSGLALKAYQAKAQDGALPLLSESAAALGSIFTYQGKLADNNSPVNDTCDLRFTLYDAASGGNIVGSTVTKSGVVVTDGLFTVSLDFGASPFAGEARWLRVQVRCPAGSGSYTTLTPRQALTAAPYALSLQPGAMIQGDVSGSALLVKNMASSGTVYGVFGRSESPAGMGVFGYNRSTIGNAYGVWGESDSTNGTGVFGYTGAASGSTTGVFGESASIIGVGVRGNVSANTGPTIGVYGTSVSSTGTGVFGYASSPTGQNYGIWGENLSTSGTGVYGSANASSGFANGVYGSSLSPMGYGGYFINFSTDGSALYASGDGGGRNKATLRVQNTEASGGMAAYMSNSSNFHTAHFQNGSTGGVLYLQNGGTNASGSNGGDFITAVNSLENDTQFRVSTSGDVSSDGSFTSPAADFAEMFPAVPGLAPGDVLVIGIDGQLARSTEPYQSSVVGVYSTQPGFVGGHPVDGPTEGSVPLAVVGIVPVKASAENGPIQPGDLLTTASTPGYAMRAGENPPVGTVIGKALAGLETGDGLILMLVMLQ